MKLPDSFSDLDNRIKIPAALAVLLIVGFAASNIGLMSSPSYSGGVEPALDPQSASMDLAESDRKGSSGAGERAESGSSDNRVVTTYRMTLGVSNVDTAMEDIEAGVRARGGFVESSSRSQDRENRGRLVVSVPANVSGAYENDLENRYEVKSKDVDREDVTETYNELEAEIESLETEYQRLNELINQTDDVETLIRLQERLSEVRSRLDYREQRLESLDEDVEYSTFHIEMESPQDFASRFNLRETLSDAYSAVFDSFRLIIIGTAYLVPFALIYATYRAAIRAKDRGF